MKPFVKEKRKVSLRVLAISCLVASLIIFIPLLAMADETSKKQDTVMVFILDSNIYTANGELIVMDVSPTIIESRTMLPIRYAAAPLGADVAWDDAARKVTVSLGETKMELWIGQSNASVNGKIVPIDADNINVKPLIINGRTMLPLRFVTETLGCEVQWEQAAKKITITKAGSPGWPIIKPKIPTIPEIIVKPPVTVQVKPDYSKLISIDISKLKTTWGLEQVGKAYNVTMGEADIPVVMRVGRGYDVFGKYASVDSLKEPVLDTAKLIKDQKMERIRFDQGENKQTVSESIRSYSNSMSTKISASGSYFGFGGSVKANFDSARTQQLNNYFSTYSYVVKKYGVYVKGAANLRDYLTADAAAMLNDNNVSPGKVFDTFGHYVLVDTITGGRIDYSITASSRASTSYENFKTAAKADFNAVVFSASGSAEYQNVKNRSEYDSNKEETLHSYGGSFTLNTGQFKNDPAVLSKWESTLEDNGTLVDFGATTARALVPVWELCNDPVRASNLKAEFEKLNLAQGNQWPTQKYVTDIVFVTDKNEWNARSKCPAGYQLINADLNSGAGGDFIYLCYKLGENISEAYTDFFMEYTVKAKNPDTKLLTHNSNNVNYTRIGTDLNKGAGGDFIYLWATRANTLPAVTNVAVAFDNPGSVNPDWPSVYWQNTKSPADVNKSVKGKYIYIKYTR
ncbi:MAG: hypothetical protein BWY65_01359 [Firmicutes bacterium ADurb.Bin373]|nr:MAG: hypothetical protein BWY65_01359 [Firmicutes bacterium ADurb.Bin373]